MKGSRRYLIGSVVADIYVNSIILGAILGIYVAVVRRPVSPTGGFLLTVAGLVSVIVYSSLVAHRVSFRTPGELMMGCIVVDGSKQWVNPYGASRTVLFVVIFIVLVTAGNSWDAIADELLYITLTPSVVIGRLFLNLGMLVGMIRIGQAQYNGFSPVMGYIVLTTISIMMLNFPAEVPASFTIGFKVFNTLVMLLAIVVLWRYRKLALDNRLNSSSYSDVVNDIS